MLGIDDINEVLDEVEPLSGKWRRFSAKLGIPNSSLDTIERNHHGDVAECLYRALVEWLIMTIPETRETKLGEVSSSSEGDGQCIV